MTSVFRRCDEGVGSAGIKLAQESFSGGECTCHFISSIFETLKKLADRHSRITGPGEKVKLVMSSLETLFFGRETLFLTTSHFSMDDSIPFMLVIRC